MIPDNTTAEGVSSGFGIRILWTSAGTFFLVIGLVGIVVPLLPTTPFLLLAAACYLRGSKRMHRWLLTNKIFGRHLDDYRERRGIPLKAKAAGMVFLWVSIGFAVFLAVSDHIIQIALIIVAIVVTIHISTIKTKSRNGLR